MVLVNRLLSWQGYYSPGKTIVVLAARTIVVPSRPLWSWQDHYLAIMVRPGPQLASCCPARTTTGKLWSGQDHNCQLWSGQDHNWQVWSGQDHNWQLWSGQDHNCQLWSDHDHNCVVRPGPQLPIMVRPGPQLASMVRPGPQLAIMVRPGPQLAIMVRPGPQLASCGPARTTSTKEVKTQTSMVMHTSFGLF